MLVWESTETASSEQSPKLLPCLHTSSLLFSPLSSTTLDGCWSSPEADDLAQYLDHLLAQAAPQKPKRQAAGSLGRFKAVAAKTKDLVSLKNKAQELDVHSEYMHFRIREDTMNSECGVGAKFCSASYLCTSSGMKCAVNRFTR